MSVNFRSLQEGLRRRLLAQIKAGELTGSHLAQQIGFQQAHISNFLNRKRGLSLEAMDAILAARGLTLADLQPAHRNSSARRRSLQAGSTGLASIPLVDVKDYLATEVPYSPAKNVVQVALSRLQKLRPAMHTPREHWQRFVALRVNAADAVAMAPRVSRGAAVVIDRHDNAAGTARQVYLVRIDNQFVLRYVERTNGQWLLRPHNADCPLTILDGDDPQAAIVGRVCLLIADF